MTRPVTSLLLAACSLVAVAAQAQTLYVQSPRARLLATPEFRAGLVSPLEKGARLQVVESRKFWYRVSTGRASGWVFAYQVSKRPPLNKVVVVTPTRVAGYGSRRRASVVTTVGAVRGLTGEDRTRASADHRFDYRALEKLDALRVSRAEAERFLEEGLQQ